MVGARLNLGTADLHLMVLLIANEDRSEVFTSNGQIDKKIWGDSPKEDFFRVYVLLVKE